MEIVNTIFNTKKVLLWALQEAMANLQAYDEARMLKISHMAGNTTWYINAYFAFAVPEEHAIVNVEEASNGTRRLFEQLAEADLDNTAEYLPLQSTHTFTPHAEIFKTAVLSGETSVEVMLSKNALKLVHKHAQFYAYAKDPEKRGVIAVVDNIVVGVMMPIAKYTPPKPKKPRKK